METIIVVKLDSFGCVVPGCQLMGLSEMMLGLEDALLAYPNPSTALFTLVLALPPELETTGALRLRVFDSLGRLVADQHLGYAYDQTIALDLSGEPPGAYHVHITDERRMLTGARLVLE